MKPKSQHRPATSDAPTGQSAEAEGGPAPKTSERLLIEVWRQTATEAEPAANVLCTTQGRAQLARFAADRYPAANVRCSFLDLYHLRLAETAIADNGGRVRLVCEPDFPAEQIDVAALPLTSQGDGELARDQLQQAYEALRPDGLLLAATDNPRDVWLGEQVAALGGKVRRLGFDEGAVYAVRHTAPLKRRRDFRCEFAFRDRERLLAVESRPGVFSHRRIDPGARRLIDAMELRDGDRVLDIGCGWGAVAVAAAVRLPAITVEAFDSNARAVECTRGNSARNGVADRVAARLAADGRVERPGTFDVALGNPPYYANFRIAELFAASAYDALRPGGRLWMVTKFPDWYLANLPTRFADVEARELKGYVVVAGRRRG
ncbi:MAG: methyltransferase [Planctomycetaceae bacterium]|nr:methyltransferase [Planctomycetaceae bacterium]